MNEQNLISPLHDKNFCSLSVFCGFILITLFVLIPVKYATAIELQLTPSIKVSQEYDDNIFFSASEQEDDYITVISPALIFTNKTERLDLNLSAKLDQNLYSENSTLDSLDSFYDGKIGYWLSERIKVNGEAGYSEDSRIDRDFETTGSIMRPVKRELQHYLLGGEWIVSEKILSFLSCVLNSRVYDDPDFYDDDDFTVTLGSSYNLSQILPKTVGRINLGYYQYTYNNISEDSISVTDSESDVDGYRWTIGVRNELSEVFILSVDLGMRYTNSKFTIKRPPPFDEQFNYESITNDQVPIYSAKIRYNGEHISSNLSLSKDIYNAGGDRGTTERTSLDWEISQKLTEEFQWKFTARYYLNRADRENMLYEELDEETYQIKPEAFYHFNPDFLISASYLLSRIDDRVGDDDRNRNLFIVQLRYRWPLSN